MTAIIKQVSGSIEAGQRWRCHLATSLKVETGESVENDDSLVEKLFRYLTSQKDSSFGETSVDRDFCLESS